MVSSWPRSETGPSTLPSIRRSSVPVICPLIARLAPRRAVSRTLALPSRVPEGALYGTTGDDAARTDRAAGAPDTACCLFHIHHPLNCQETDLVWLRVR